MSTELEVAIRDDNGNPKDSEMLRAHLRKQENRIRQLATKLVQVMSDRRSKERRDDAQLEGQRNRIRELENTVNTLRDKLHVSRTQLAAQTKLLPQSTYHPPSQGVDSKGALLLLEARAANGALEERVRVLSVGLADAEAELEAVTTEIRTKEIEHEEEMGALRAALERGAGGAKEAHIADNIHLIRLTRESKRTAAWAATLEAQVQTLESNLTSSAETIRTLEGDLSSVREELRTEQTRALQLQRDAETASSAALRTRDIETQLSAAQDENAILVEANSSLVAKAFAHVERTEAERTQLAQSLATIKTLEESLLRETEAKKTFEVELEAEKSNVRSHNDQVAVLEEKIKEVECQLSETKKTQESVPVPVVESKSQAQEEVKVDHQVVTGICEKCRNFELDLARAECRLSQTREELSKSKQLLLAQILANKELRNEIEDLSRRLDSADSKTSDQLTAFMKKLEERASKVELLEKSIEQLKLPKSKPKPKPSEIETEKCKTPQVEIYIDRLSFQDVNATDGNALFATWEFDGRPEYTPVVQDGIFNTKATYNMEKTIDKEEMLHVIVEIHVAIGDSDSRRLGSGVLIFSAESTDITTSNGELLGQLTYKILTKNITFCFQKPPEKQENHQQPVPVPRKRILPAITTSPASSQATEQSISPNNSVELPENHEESESETKAIFEEIRHKNVESQPQHVVPKPRVEKIIKVKGPPSRSSSPTPTCSLPTVQEEPIPVQNLSTVSLQPPNTPKKPILRQNSSSPAASPKVKKRVTIDESPRRSPVPEKSKVVIFLNHLVFNVESAHLWRNGQIGGLFVEYRFLDYKPEETESRSISPPKVGRETEPLNLEFSREFDLNPQRLHMLKSLLESSHSTTITIVSEPLEEDMGDCEDIGSAVFVLSRLAHDGSPTLLPIKTTTSPHYQIGTIAISVKIT